MKALLAGVVLVFSLALPGALLASNSSWQVPYGPPLVVVPHDREPAGQRESSRDRDVTTPDDECHEQHHLTPDGDHDCDDPVSVPEPGTLGLMGLGVVGLLLARRRR